MERRAILQSLIAGLAIGSIKTVCDADDKGKDTKGLLVHSGEDRNRAGFSHASFLVSGKDNGGALCISGGDWGTHLRELLSHGSQPAPTAFGGPIRPPGFHGIPLHIHYEQDEYWYTLYGEGVIQVGDQKFYPKAGDLVMGPRGVPHSPRGLKNWMIITAWQPAGTMEEFFHDLVEAERKGGNKMPGPDELAALFMAHGMKMVGPPVEP